MSNLSTPSPTVRRSIFGGTRDVVPFFFFCGPCSRHKLLKLENCLRCVCALLSLSLCLRLSSLPRLAGNFAHDSTWFLPNGKKYIAFIFYWSRCSASAFDSSAVVVGIKSIFDWCQYYYHFIMAIYLWERTAGVNSWICHSCCVFNLDTFPVSKVHSTQSRDKNKAAAMAQIQLCEQISIGID